jgi:hypothetical protein
MKAKAKREGNRISDSTRIILKRFADEIVVTDVTGRPTRVASAISRNRKGNSELKKGEHLMKTLMKSKRHSRGLLLSILCAGVLATFLGGCAEGPYVTAYDTGYYPTSYYGYYGYPASYYYGPTYDGTIVRSGVRYNDAYGPRYYDRTVYGDW